MDYKIWLSKFIRKPNFLISGNFKFDTVIYAYETEAYFMAQVIFQDKVQ